MTPADIQLLFAAAGPSFAGGYNGGAGLASPLTLASIETAQRTAELRQVLLAVQQYWLAGSPDMDLAAEILGDASRDGETSVQVAGRTALYAARMPRIFVRLLTGCSIMAEGHRRVRLA